MTFSHLFCLLPLMVIAAASVLVMLFAAFRRSHLAALMLTLGGICVALMTIPLVYHQPLPLRQVGPLLTMDGYALTYIGLILAVAFVVAVLSFGYPAIRCERPEEYYVLLLVAVLGSMVLAASNHFASFFLGVEMLSIPLYGLIAYPRTGSRRVEAAIKYLILSAVSASFLLFGMALAYHASGTMEFTGLTSLLSSPPVPPLALAGVAMIVVGMGFKLGVVPFHMWTPDVYEGAPAPVAAFIATVSKGAVFALMLRFFPDADMPGQEPLILVFAAISIASMFGGNLLALFQTNVKRLLAYSSIAHFGYLLVAFLATGPLRVIAVTIYLAQYFVSTLGAFAVVGVMSQEARDADCIEDYYGLASRLPWLAAVFALMLFSLAGIPLTAGFTGKFFVITAGIGSALRLLVILLVVNSVIGLFYYLRVIAALFAHPPDPPPAALPRPSRASLAVLAGLTLLLLWWGILPDSLIRMVLIFTSGS